MGITLSCVPHLEGDMLGCPRQHSVASSSTTDLSDCDEDLDLGNRFHWVPPKGWDDHARKLRICARNSLHWQGDAPVPIAPTGSAWLLPCSDTLSLRIAKLQEMLVKAGWKIITSPPHVIESLGNKANLPHYAAKIGMAEFLPQHYASPERAVYPCVLKPAKGEYGANTWICMSRDDVYRNTQNFSTTAWVLQELVTGNVEFSVSLLVSRGVILDVVGMRYIYDRPEYIWPDVKELRRGLCEVPMRHVAAMARFILEYDGILNFNYKERPDGRICIFEVNTRIGADLGCDAPRERARQLFNLLDQIRG